VISPNEVPHKHFVALSSGCQALRGTSVYEGNKLLPVASKVGFTLALLGYSAAPSEAQTDCSRDFAENGLIGESASETNFVC
jgi:hypothetical protein